MPTILKLDFIVTLIFQIYVTFVLSGGYMWEISVLCVFRFLICIASEISDTCIRKIFNNLFIQQKFRTGYILGT